MSRGTWTESSPPKIGSLVTWHNTLSERYKIGVITGSERSGWWVLWNSGKRLFCSTWQIFPLVGEQPDKKCP